jgi:hypothetical protein
MQCVRVQSVNMTSHGSKLRHSKRKRVFTRPGSSARITMPVSAAAQTAHYLIICYGSREGDPIGDERFGPDQRRLEIDFRIRLPCAEMEPVEIREYVNEWIYMHYPDIKHR